MNEMKNEWTVDKKTKLLKYLYEQIPEKSRNSVKSILGRGQVVLNGRITKQFDDPL